MIMKERPIFQLLLDGDVVREGPLDSLRRDYLFYMQYRASMHDCVKVRLVRKEVI